MTGFCILGEKMFFFEIFLKTKYRCIALGLWECSFVVEHTTADREVGGSIPLAPFFVIVCLLVERLQTFEFKISFNSSLF